MSNSYGIPAFIPTQIDSPVQEAVGGSLVDTAINSTLRVVAYTNKVTSDVTISTYLRSSDYLLNTTVFSLGSVVVQLAARPCGRVPIVFWLRTDGVLEYTVWNGNGWEPKVIISSAAIAMDACSAGSGCHLAWLEGGIKLGQFVDGATSTDSYGFPTTLNIAADTVAPLQVALDVSPNGEIAVAWASASHMSTAVLSDKAVKLSSTLLVVDATLTVGAEHGLTLAYRGLRNSAGHVPYVIYLALTGTSSNSTFAYEIESLSALLTNFPIVKRRQARFYNSQLASRAFRVGDEVFVWIHGTNTDTRCLLAGVTKAQRCAIADREEAAVPVHMKTGLVNLPAVTVDPSDEHRLTWARMVDIAPYPIPGNARLGDMNFLPRLSTARFGRSAYIAGSLVRNWDGNELGDAGFHDYPRILAATPATISGVLPTGVYYIRVYAVRYNNKGERFQSVTVGSDAINVTGPTGSVDMLVKTIILSNHDDVQLEVYMTKAGLSTYYLNQVVSNNRDIDLVAFTITGNEAVGPVDPHGPNAGQEIEEFGPTGCEIVVTAGDRLWATGGQVPRGTAVFSKLIEPNEGAGFDAIAGFVVLDASGGALTSLVGFGDSAIVGFELDKIFIINGAGPGNLVGDSGYPAPRLTIADGASTHWGTLALPVGIVFWGADGPRLLNLGDGVAQICEPVVKLTKTLTPTGVRVDLTRNEVVWYTETGDAVLWNYSGGNSRWAQWDNLPIAGVSSNYLVTTDGHLLKPASTPKDDGRRFEFKFGTGLIRPEKLLQDYTKIRRIGLAGEYLGPHRVRITVYFDGSPMWSERYTWEPSANTWLAAAETFDALTAAQIDALATTDKSGGYSTHHRTERQTCKFLRVVISDCGDSGFVPWELSFELGQKPGMGRTSVNTFTK